MPTAKPYAGIEATPEYRHYRLSLVHRFVRKKPTVRERMALDNAARLHVRAYFASADHSTTPDMQCKLNAAAEHALAALRLVASERPLRPAKGVRLASAFEARA